MKRLIALVLSGLLLVSGLAAADSAVDTIMTTGTTQGVYG